MQAAIQDLRLGCRVPPRPVDLVESEVAIQVVMQDRRLCRPLPADQANLEDDILVVTQDRVDPVVLGNIIEVVPQDPQLCRQVKPPRVDPTDLEDTLKTVTQDQTYRSAHPLPVRRRLCMKLVVLMIPEQARYPHPE
uniref:Uncharacterized protein n=1 Tax=Globisporangium ultimum (strain ATCC 200006 / CBS 805.95 / DAOM BR144) TaxID=431595 RepID=K3WTX5_GLOUD